MASNIASPEIAELFRWAAERAWVFKVTREARSLTRAQMAELLGKPATEFFVACFERGDPGRIRDEKMPALVEAWRRLGVS